MASEWRECPQCGTRIDPGDTSCRVCGAAPPTAVTVVSDSSIEPASAADLEQLTVELREAITPGIQLIRYLASGGMGAVFLGRDPQLRRLVVIKVLGPALANDDVAHARFLREAQAAASLAHPHVVSVYQVGELPQSGVPYFVMQYIDGVTLQAQMQSTGAFGESEAKRVVGEIASALAAAHERGLIHRDIKPANVMLDRESGRAIVLDFGIAAAVEQDRAGEDLTLTAIGTIVGTPVYMSPEQAVGGAVTPQSDIYSLGVLAFEMVSGNPPFTGDTPMELIAAHVKDPAPPIRKLRSDLDAQFADLVDRSRVVGVVAGPAPRGHRRVGRRYRWSGRPYRPLSPTR